MRTTHHRIVIAALAVLVLLALPLDAAVHKMFVTSATGTADLSSWALAEGNHGLAAGDHICQKLAAAIPGVVASNFVAWLSTPDVDGYCHVAGFDGDIDHTCNQGTLPDAGPWVRTDGQPFSNDLQTLINAHTVLYPPFVDETGASVGRSNIHTGTASDGREAIVGGATTTCPDSLGNPWAESSSVTPPRQYIGFTSEGAFWWTNAEVDACSAEGRLLCFEKGSGDALAPFAQPGARVFVSSEVGPGDLSQWPHTVGTGLAGVAAADHVCRELAREDDLAAPDSFVAWLSTPGHPALNRLTLDGPWRRPGGVEIAANKAGLLTGSMNDLALESDIEVDEKAVHISGSVWTGTGVDGQPTGFDCAGWTSTSAGDSATTGFRQSASGQWTDENTHSCESGRPIYCFSNVVPLFWDAFEKGNLSAWDAHLH